MSTAAELADDLPHEPPTALADRTTRTALWDGSAASTRLSTVPCPWSPTPARASRR